MCDRCVAVTVRDLIRELEKDGWYFVRQTGGHRHFRHPSKPGSVCVSGGLGKEMPKGPLGNIVRQAGLERKTR